MSIRDHVIEINRGVDQAFNTVFEVFWVAGEWCAPFVPWALVLGFLIALVLFL